MKFLVFFAIQAVSFFIVERVAIGCGVDFQVGFQGIVAIFLSVALRQERWWWLINLCFLPVAFIASAHSVDSRWYLLGLIALGMVFWGTVKGDAPLFLSSKAMAETLIGEVVAMKATSVVDLGAGFGSAVIPLAKACPDVQVTAVEYAPIPWLVLAWRCRKLRNVTVKREDLWRTNLSSYQAVFVFLTPAVMDGIMAKCGRELKKGSVMLSSAFLVPDREADFVRSEGHLALYGYRF